MWHLKAWRGRSVGEQRLVASDPTSDPLPSTSASASNLSELVRLIRLGNLATNRELCPVYANTRNFLDQFDSSATLARANSECQDSGR